MTENTPQGIKVKNRLFGLGMLFVIVCFSQGNSVFAQSKKTAKNITQAPLPASISNAKKVYVLDGQTTSQYLTRNGNELAFDTFYSEMKDWKKFEVVDSLKAADIVIELQYHPYFDSSGMVGADFALVIYDAATKEQLWSANDTCGTARLVSNQRKEVVKSVDRLVENLKSRLQPCLRIMC